LEQNF